MSRSQGPVTYGGNGQPQWPQGQAPAGPPQRQGAPQAPAWPQQGQPPQAQPPYRGQPSDANAHQYYPTLDPRQASIPPQHAQDYAPQFGQADLGGAGNSPMAPGMMAQSANGWVGGVAPQPEEPYAYPGANRTVAPPAASQGYARPAANFAPPQQQYAQAQYAQEPVYAPAQDPRLAHPIYADAREPRTGAPQAQGLQAQGYEAWPNGQAAEPRHDPRGYDLGHYAPAAPQGGAYAQAPQAYAAQGDGYADPYQQQYASQGQPGGDPSLGFGNAQGGQQHAYDDLAPDGIEEFEDEAEPGSGRRKWLLVSAALVVALAVGGGGMYVYKTVGFGGGPGKLAMFNAKTGSPPPTITADKTPTKVAPADVGGRDFANKDLKLYERFGETRTADAGSPPQVPGMVVIPPPQASASAADAVDPSAPRAVKTIPISPSGQQMQAPMAVPAQPLPRVPNATVKPNNGPLPQVPGMSLENLGGRVGLSPDAPAGSVEGTQAVPQPKPGVRTASAAATPSGLGAGQVAAAAPTVKKAAAPAAAKPAGAPVPKAAAAQQASTGGGGYVAWVTSHQNQGDALAQFAGLKQKYPDLMSNKQPDIKTANLNEKGTWYRVRIGPASSKSEMDELCLKLKASGLKDCFPQHQ